MRKGVRPQYAVWERKEVIAAPPCPPKRPLERLASAVVRHRMLEAFVEHHRDVGPELRLNVDRRFGCQQMFAAVEMRSKGRAFLVDLAPRGQTENLIAAAVCKDWLVPADESMKTAECADAGGAGPQVEMIGIRENDLRSQRIEVSMRHCLDCALRADRHEGRRVDVAMGRREHTSPRGAVGVGHAEAE